MFAVGSCGEPCSVREWLVSSCRLGCVLQQMQPNNSPSSQWRKRRQQDYCLVQFVLLWFIHLSLGLLNLFPTEFSSLSAPSSKRASGSILTSLLQNHHPLHLPILFYIRTMHGIKILALAFISLAAAAPTAPHVHNTEEPGPGYGLKIREAHVHVTNAEEPGPGYGLKVREAHVHATNAEEPGPGYGLKARSSTHIHNAEEPGPGYGLKARSGQHVHNAEEPGPGYGL